MGGERTFLGEPLVGCNSSSGHCGGLHRVGPGGPGGGEAVNFFDYAALILALAAVIYVLAALLRPEKF
ncbi:potassium-transporting ATPase subunit F [Arthrobacter sp.]|uniref:potassium-transporting ATPase subunit F n=1 Tax=Arthrobacter sp. TaxID=1667 RepID=UPI0037BF442C